jgi:hypothetical protein
VHVIGNHIEGNNQGIHVNSGATCANGGLERLVIADNFISTATECIYDEASIAFIINNRCMTEQSDGSAGAGVITGNTFRSAGNMICGDDLANAHWPALGTLAG